LCLTLPGGLLHNKARLGPSRNGYFDSSARREGMKAEGTPV
jgi:hypothetical protein